MIGVRRSTRYANRSRDGPRRRKEEYWYEQAKRSAVRAVWRRNGRKVLTRMRTKNADEDAHSAFDHAFLREKKWPTPRASSQPVRVVDLFCGCGALSLGAAEACRAMGKNFLPAGAVDNDPAAIETYERNFRCRAFLSDVTEILNAELGPKPTQEELRFLDEVGEVDLLLAGPPCQGYSDLNNYTRRNDPRNALYERAARFVEIAKPKHVLIENVPGAVHGKEMAVKKTVNSMRKLGYYIDDAVIDLVAIGVPQRRRRHIVAASLTTPLSVVEVIEEYRVTSPRSVEWAIGDLEDESGDGAFTAASHHTKENCRRISYLHENGLYDLPDELRPPCHQNGGHSYKSVYGRLWWERPAQTITSGFNSPGQGRFVHPSRPRTIIPHEAARLQFFPDFFDFSRARKRTQLSRLIGNAAPMKLSYVFCLEFLA